MLTRAYKMDNGQPPDLAPTPTQGKTPGAFAMCV